MQDVRAIGKGIASRERAVAARSVARGGALFATLLGIALAVLAGPALADEPRATADPEYWQDRYRDLVVEAERLRATVERERELYADANRRNYRRGTKRHVHREAATKAEDELARVEAQLETIQDEARRSGAPRGWLNKVEIELEDRERRPAVASSPDDDGRNPLYRKSGRDEARGGSESDERDAGRNPLYLDQAPN